MNWWEMTPEQRQAMHANVRLEELARLRQAPVPTTDWQRGPHLARLAREEAWAERYLAAQGRATSGSLSPQEFTAQDGLNNLRAAMTGRRGGF